MARRSVGTVAHGVVHEGRRAYALDTLIVSALLPAEMVFAPLAAVIESAPSVVMAWDAVPDAVTVSLPV